MWFFTSKLVWWRSPSAVIPLHAPIRRDKRLNNQPNIWMTMGQASSMYLYVWTGWLRDKVAAESSQSPRLWSYAKGLYHAGGILDWLTGQHEEEDGQIAFGRPRYCSKKIVIVWETKVCTSTWSMPVWMDSNSDQFVQLKKIVKVSKETSKLETVLAA